jgi:septum formation protein
MRAFGPADLEAYLASGIWEGKSGAYAIQGEADPFVRVVAGSLSNVVGLPLESLGRVLAWLGGSATIQGAE